MRAWASVQRFVGRIFFFTASRPVRAAVLLLALAACQEDYKFYGIPLNPMVTAPTAALTRGDGSRFAIGAQKGRASLVFFGYTHCPDICPTTLSHWTRVKKALGSDASKVNFVFVTIDPENDTPEVIARYMKNFDTTFVGLTGAPAEIDSIAKAFGVSAFQDGTLESGHAAMAHPSRVYLVDPEGRIRFVYPPGLQPEEVAEDMKHVL